MVGSRQVFQLNLNETAHIGKMFHYKRWGREQLCREAVVRAQADPVSTLDPQGSRRDGQHLPPGQRPADDR